MSTADIVKEILVRETHVDTKPEAISADDLLLSEKVKLNSISFIRVIIGIEDRLKVSFPDTMLMNESFSTVGDLIAYVDDIVAGA